MSDQENIKPDEENEDVEAHRRKPTVSAAEGEVQDDSKDDDVELHARKKNVL